MPHQLAPRIRNRHRCRKARAKVVPSAVLRPMNLLLDRSIPGPRRKRERYLNLNLRHPRNLHLYHLTLSNNQMVSKDRKPQRPHQARRQILDLLITDTPHPVLEKEHHSHIKHHTTGTKAPLAHEKSQRVVDYKWFWVRQEVGQS
jgi:hypothetical protein